MKALLTSKNAFPFIPLDIVSKYDCIVIPGVDLGTFMLGRPVYPVVPNNATSVDYIDFSDFKFEEFATKTSLERDIPLRFFLLINEMVSDCEVLKTNRYEGVEYAGKD